MAEITRRRIGELVQGVLRILRDKPEGMRARDVVAALEKVVPPTDFELSPYPSRPDSRRYDQIARFATISPVKAGWLVKSKGRWSITDAGSSALNALTDPERLIRESIRLYGLWKAAQDDGSEPEEAIAEAAGVPPEDAAVAPPVFEDAEGEAWDQIEAHVARMDPYAFQDLVAALLTAMGYHVAWKAPPGPDHGIDIVAYPDPLGAREPCVKVSVRRRSVKADVKDLREFISVLHDSDVGIFVSMSGFTKPAEDLSRAERRKVRLFDIEKVFDLWVEHYPRIDESSKRLLPLRPIYFLAPSTGT
ncbi:MAG: Mrr restriction system protein [Myxococcota bacterium]|nr:Mrr restriction system protein [Myxococcota bacterium]